MGGEVSTSLVDLDKAFVNPKPRHLVAVPLEFRSAREWAEIIAHNLLAEYWCVVTETSGQHLSVVGGGGSEVVINVRDEGEVMVQHLLVSRGAGGRSLHIVGNQTSAGPGQLRLALKPGLKSTVGLRSLGYIGSFIAELKALAELANGSGEGNDNNVLRSILQPRLEFDGDWARKPLLPDVPINPSQRQTVLALRLALEKIQGPPGTGKSTTIFHIVTARVPSGERILVTCSRNVAVESIAQKLERCTDDRMVVIGNASRVGPTARRHLLDAKVDRHRKLAPLQKMAGCVRDAHTALDASIKAFAPKTHSLGQETLCSSCRSQLWGRALLALRRRRIKWARWMREYCERISKITALVSVSVGGEVKRAVLQDAEIMLCTIASTSRLLREWEEMPFPLRVHTVIIDECGCTPESSVGLLLRLEPRNIVLVGDHRQLPPCSLIHPQQLRHTGHDRSLLERCVLASGQVHRLREQYRMHDDICRLVSELFYNGMVTTGGTVAKDRAAKDQTAIFWVESKGWETTRDGETSYVNTDEVDDALRIARSTRAKRPDDSVAILTFYKGQWNLLMETVPATLGIEVLTVDSCQGSEFDHVILSTVRSNPRGSIGFVNDKRRINVAISRAKHTLVIVGSGQTLSTDKDWARVWQRSAKRRAAEWPLPPSSVAGGSVSGGGHLNAQTGLSMKDAARMVAAPVVDTRLGEDETPLALIRKQFLEEDHGRGSGRGGGVERGSENGNFVATTGGRSAGICFDFEKGRCHRGAACRFSHSSCGNGSAHEGHCVAKEFEYDDSAFPSLGASTVASEQYRPQPHARIGERQGGSGSTFVDNRSQSVDGLPHSSFSSATLSTNSGRLPLGISSSDYAGDDVAEENLALLVARDEYNDQSSNETSSMGRTTVKHDDEWDVTEAALFDMFEDSEHVFATLQRLNGNPKRAFVVLLEEQAAQDKDWFGDDDIEFSSRETAGAEWFGGQGEIFAQGAGGESVPADATLSEDWWWGTDGLQVDFVAQGEKRTPGMSGTTESDSTSGQVAQKLENNRHTNPTSNWEDAGGEESESSGDAKLDGHVSNPPQHAGILGEANANSRGDGGGGVEATAFFPCEDVMFWAKSRMQQLSLPHDYETMCQFLVIAESPEQLSEYAGAVGISDERFLKEFWNRFGGKLIQVMSDNGLERPTLLQAAYVSAALRTKFAVDEEIFGPYVLSSLKDTGVAPAAIPELLDMLVESGGSGASHSDVLRFLSSPPTLGPIT